MTQLRSTQTSVIRPVPWDRVQSLLKRGFSLVEVTIALAVISFALVALLGLLGTSLASAKESSEETAKVAILNFMTAEIRSPGTNATLALASPGRRFYFDSLGRFLEIQPNQGPSAGNLPHAHYVVMIVNAQSNTFQTQAQLRILSPYPNWKQTNHFPISAPR